MNDRKMPTPRSPFTEALKSDLHDNAREAERLYDSNRRREVTEANEALEEQGKDKSPAGDPASSANQRKPV